MKRTNKYGMIYFEKNDYTNSIAEMQRWETLDNQLYALFNVLGNGVISGWNIIESSGLSVVITPGQGHVFFVAVETTENTVLNLTGGTEETPQRNYIYAALSSDSYWTKEAVISSDINLKIEDEMLLLGYVDVDDVGVITDGINTDGRKYLGFIELVQNTIKAHRHIGGTENPIPVNLATDVQGQLNQESIPPLDASVFQTGLVDPDRLPLIDHVTKLTNQGVLTHAQLDDFVNSLSLPNQKTMGEVSTTNLLQLILALKHIYPDIDEFLVNEIAFIPGISPDDYIDTVNTTAIVDTRTSLEGGTHTITGVAATGLEAYSRIWDTEVDFGDETLSRTVTSGDSVVLDTKENILVIDEFEDISTWTIETEDYSTIPPIIIDSNSANIDLQNQSVNIMLRIKKTFDAQDWSGYNYLRFLIKTTSVEHGDLYFYLNDNIYGQQNSYKVVLNRNSPTVDVDTGVSGWQEVIIDVTGFNRSTINEIGFYVNTQSGWDTSKGFSLSISNITLSTGNIYEDDGYIRFTFGSDFLYRFWRVRWDAIVPSDSESTNVNLQVRIRVANTLIGLETATWTDYGTTSPYDIDALLPVGDLYKYIQIEFFFTASDSLKRSEVLKKVYLDYYAADVDNSFEYDSQTDWESGTLFNIDTKTYPGSMVVSGIGEIGNVIYGTDGKVITLNDSFVELSSITGTMLPRSTYQILNDMSPSFGTITAVTRSNNNNLWVCDTDNDRVLEIDPAGNAIRGFFGSYLVENAIGVSNTTTTTTTTVPTTPELLQVIYNKIKGYLYLVFDRDLTTQEIALLIGKRIKVGNNIFYLDGLQTAVALTGFEHVIKVTLTGSELTAFNQLVYPDVPSISIISPYQNQLSSSSTVAFKFLVYGFEIGDVVGDNFIRVTIDNSTVYDIFTETLSVSGLSNGYHSVKAQLVNGDSSLNTNIEAIAEENFIVQTGTYSLPYIYITSPRGNQIYSSSPVQIEFVVKNFPIIPNGQHLAYSVDGGNSLNYYSESPILIDNLSAGEHSIYLYLVNENGVDLGYTYGSATINFIVGVNSNASSKFYCEYSGATLSSSVLFSDLILSDVYAPFDVQYIPYEVSDKNPSGKESILIGKLTNNFVLSKLET